MPRGALAASQQYLHDTVSKRSRRAPAANSPGLGYRARPVSTAAHVVAPLILLVDRLPVVRGWLLSSGSPRMHNSGFPSRRVVQTPRRSRKPTPQRALSYSPFESNRVWTELAGATDAEELLSLGTVGDHVDAVSSSSASQGSCHAKFQAENHTVGVVRGAEVGAELGGDISSAERVAQGRGTLKEQLRKLGMSGRWPHALEMFRKQLRGGGGTGAILDAFEGAMFALGINGKWSVALPLINDMKAQGIILNDRTYADVIAACGKSGRVTAAIDTLDAFMLQGRVPSRAMFVTVANACIRSGSTEQVTSVFSKSQRCGGDVGSNVYRKAMFRCSKRRESTQVIYVWDLYVGGKGHPRNISAREVHLVAQAMGALHDWQGLVRLLTSSFTPGGAAMPPLDEKNYHWLATAYAQLGNAQEVLETVKEMDACGIAPGARTWTRIFNAFLRDGGGRWTAAVEVFEAVRSSYTEGGLGSSACLSRSPLPATGITIKDVLTEIWCRTISILAQGCQWHRVFSLLQEARDEGIDVQAATYDTVIDALGKAREDKKIVFLFEEFGGQQLRLASRSYSRIMVALNRLGRLEDTVDAFSKLSADGHLVGAIGVNAAMHAAGALGQPDKALDFFAQMKAKGLSPTEVSYSTVINACSKAHTDVEAFTRKAVSLLHEMSAVGLPPYPAAHRAALTAVTSVQGLESAMSVLEDMKSQGIRLTSYSYSPALKAAAKVGDWQVAIGCIDSMSRDALTQEGAGPDVLCFNYAMAACVKAGESEVALELLKRLGACGVAPNLVTYSVAMDACAKAGWWQKALNFLTELRSEGIAPNVYTFTAAVEACATAGEHGAVKSLLERMVAEGVAPTVVTYSTALKVCNDMKMAEEIVAMMKLRGVKPNLVTYTELISICGRAGEVHQALAQLNNARLDGLVPNVINYNCCVDVCAKAGEVDHALALLEQMQSSPEPDVEPDIITYNSVINACAKAGDWALSLWLISEIAAAGLKADVQSFNSALDACTKGSNPEAAVSLLRRMRVQGLVPNAISYQSAISACRAGGDGWSARMLLDEMLAQGLTPRAADYNIVLETVGRDGDWARVIGLLQKMKADGVKPDAYSYGAAIGACSKGRKPAMARELFREMNHLGLSPTRYCWNAIVNVHARTGDTKGALAFMKEMKQAMPCDEAVFSAVIHGCAQTRDWEAAENMLDDMRAAGLQPNDACYYTLISAASKAGELTLAEMLLASMREDDLPLDLYAYTTVFAGCASFHDWRLAMRLLEWMGAEDVVPTARIFNLALRACGQGEAEVASVLLDMMRRRGVDGDSSGYAAALLAFQKAGRPDKVLALMDNMRRHGPKPDLECFNAAIKTCAVADDLNACLALLFEMGRQGVQPDKYSFRPIVAANERSGTPSMQKELQEAMVNLGYRRR